MEPLKPFRGGGGGGGGGRGGGCSGRLRQRAFASGGLLEREERGRGGVEVATVVVQVLKGREGDASTLLTHNNS